jgi:hypothetical protein
MFLLPAKTTAEELQTQGNKDATANSASFILILSGSQVLTHAHSPKKKERKKYSKKIGTDSLQQILEDMRSISHTGLIGGQKRRRKQSSCERGDVTALYKFPQPKSPSCTA